jgi:hypothetical protein
MEGLYRNTKKTKGFSKSKKDRTDAGTAFSCPVFLFRSTRSSPALITYKRPAVTKKEL